MAEVSPFQVDRGDAQGRVLFAGLDGAAEHLEESYAFQLGHLSRTTEYFEIGNYIEVTQSVSYEFATQKLVRLLVHVLSPSTTTPGVRWRFTAALGAVTFYTRYIPADGRDLQLSDIALSLAAAPAPPTTVALTFRLQLVAA